MDKDVESTRWAQYQFVMPDMDEESMDECLNIIERLENRKTGDVINWEEKQALNEATKRSGHFIGSSSGGYDGEVAPGDETAGATSDKEKELMSGMSDILKDMEKLDD